MSDNSRYNICLHKTCNLENIHCKRIKGKGAFSVVTISSQFLRVPQSYFKCLIHKSWKDFEYDDYKLCFYTHCGFFEF